MLPGCSVPGLRGRPDGEQRSQPVPGLHGRVYEEQAEEWPAAAVELLLRQVELEVPAR